MLGAERNPSLGTLSFNPYSAGRKIYGQVSGSPTSGPVDKTGYAARDQKLRAKRNAILARMKAMNVGAYAKSNSLNGGV